MDGRHVGKAVLTSDFAGSDRAGDLQTSYNDILLNSSVIIIYASGLPLMWWLGALIYGSSYFVAKLDVLRFSSKPRMWVDPRIFPVFCRARLWYLRMKWFSTAVVVGSQKHSSGIIVR